MESTEAGLGTIWPLVGRDQELRQVAAARTDAECSACVVSAAAGVGKSRLAREVMAAANDELTLWAQATASSSKIPLGALASVVPEEVRSEDPFELLRRSAAALRARADGRRVLLVVDDAQLLDPVSATLILQLAASQEVFVLATIRAGEPTPDAVESLWKEDGARRVELGALSEQAVVAMLEAGLSGPLDQATTRQIADVSAGNPLYVRELVLGALEDGRLRQTRGLWRLEGRVAVTPSLTALMTRRLGTLKDDSRRLLELLALGEPLRLQEAAAMTSYATLEAGEERGMIAIAGPSQDSDVRLAHPMYGEVIRSELQVVRGRAHRLELAEVVQQRSILTADDALRVVRWLLGAGANVPVELLVDAAEAANLAGDPELGADLAHRALDANAGLRATLALSRAYVCRNRLEEAEQVLAEAESTVGTDARALDYLDHRTHVLQWGLGRFNDAWGLVERSREWSEEPAWTRAIVPYAVSTAAFADGFDGNVEPMREIISDRRYPGAARAAISMTLAMSLLAKGQVREASDLARKLRPRPPLRSHVDAYTLGVTSLVGEDGGEDWPDLRAYLDETLREAVRVNDHEAAGFAALILGSLGFRRGRYHDSVRWLTEAEIQFEQHGTFDQLSIVAALRVGIACFTKQPAAAQAAVQILHKRMANRAPHPGQLVLITCAEGWGARATSDRRGAEMFLMQASKTQNCLARSRLLHEALRSGARPDRIAAELTELAADGDSAGFEARAAHATALARRDPKLLLTASEHLNRIGFVAAAVEACVSAARLFADEGRSDSARRAVVQARELHRHGQGWELSALDDLDSGATQLTTREAQVVSLVAKGLTSAEIAEQLVLSVRTVETYIYRAMRKRGVTTRSEL
jgi:DNA-binding CsgD family transcriptional regulator